ncbi:LysM peptidoglycan-binding domain-containing protein [Aliidiomarina sanyensis]|uniref:Type IV secretion system putative lipoprotein virB7 n=1 Tax=Aliidiomarina sanyensis TaxID=1249555 RepID=A0A432WN84_9GAMM|nr:LysM peptidoglycan-binding domain-containing protein [Aliidiomarina sanyensis]RUO35262.1 lytic transglycosylase [Aliidiomarina sanyensis]
MKRVLIAASALFVLSGCQLTGSDTDQAATPTKEYPLQEGLHRYALVHPVLVESTSRDEELPAQLQADIWDRIRLQMSLEVPDHPLVQTHRDWYLRHPGYIDRVAQRAAPFLHMIVEEIEKRDLPVELVLVPVIESAFDTFAYSHGRASGIWQFIPSTARFYGLDINWWYDGRRDVMAATTTALDYFDRLGQTFDGDWLLALAAYNGGQGRVLGAVRRNEQAGRGTDFWSLDSLPRETRNYVPKILALASLLKDSETYAVTWPYIPNQPVMEMVDVGQQIDLALAAEMAGLSLEELHRYNSGYNRWATAPDGPHTLLLPIERARQFQDALQNTDPAEWLAWERHQVRSGESLITIARRYNTTPTAIQQFNNLSGTIIRQGQYLLIPVASQDLERYTLSAEQRLASTQNRQQGTRVEHRVTRGDTLWDLSRTYGVTVANLARWNNMAPGDMLRPGQTLVIWQNQQTATTASTSGSTPVMRTIQYQVRSGDSLARIASRFRVTVADIERWNSISRDRFLQPGQRLTLHVDVTQVNI